MILALFLLCICSYNKKGPFHAAAPINPGSAGRSDWYPGALLAHRQAPELRGGSGGPCQGAQPCWPRRERKGWEGRKGRNRSTPIPTGHRAVQCGTQNLLVLCCMVWFAEAKELACEITSINLQRIPSPYFVVLVGSGEDLGGLRSTWGAGGWLQK